MITMNVVVTQEGVIIDIFESGELINTFGRTFEEWKENPEVDLT